MKNPKKSLFFLSVLLIVSVFALTFSACSSPTSTTKTYTIKYEVTGTAKTASIFYRNETGGFDEREEKLPWSKTITVSASEKNYFGASLSATDYNFSGGNLTAIIYVDGKTVKTASGVNSTNPITQKLPL